MAERMSRTIPYVLCTQEEIDAEEELEQIYAQLCIQLKNYKNHHRAEMGRRIAKDVLCKFSLHTNNAITYTPPNVWIIL